MKKFKRFVVAGAIVLVVGATALTALAVSNPGTPAEILAGLTNRTVEDVTAQKTESGGTYGTIASEAGVLDEFKTQMIEQREAVLEEKVAEGTMTQERADTIIAAMEANQADCDGTGNGGTCAGTCGGTGAGMGNGFGAGTCGGTCDGTGTGGMNGYRHGGQGGMGRGMGTCVQ